MEVIYYGRCVEGVQPDEQSPPSGTGGGSGVAERLKKNGDPGTGIWWCAGEDLYV